MLRLYLQQSLHHKPHAVYEYESESESESPLLLYVVMIWFALVLPRPNSSCLSALRLWANRLQQIDWRHPSPTETAPLNRSPLHLRLWETIRWPEIRSRLPVPFPAPNPSYWEICRVIKLGIQKLHLHAFQWKKLENKPWDAQEAELCWGRRVSKECSRLSLFIYFIFVCITRKSSIPLLLCCLEQQRNYR